MHKRQREESGPSQSSAERVEPRKEPQEKKTLHNRGKAQARTGLAHRHRGSKTSPEQPTLAESMYVGQSTTDVNP